VTTEEFNTWLAERTREDGACLAWTKATNSSSQPVAFIDGKAAQSVRRFVVRMSGRPIHARQVVIVTCGNPLCLNADHLRVGLHSTAMKLAWDRGAFNKPLRQSKGRLAAQAKSKLSMEAARDIRLRCANGESKAELAREYDVWPSAIYAIVNHERWADTGGFFDQLMGK
jgi:hypothetical protein